MSIQKNAFLSTLFSKIKQNKKTIFFLFLIFALAFGTRSHLIIYNSMFGFDTYFHAKVIANLLQTGSIPSIDTTAYYYLPEGGAPMPKQGLPFWYISAFIYTLLTLGAGYSKQQWINIAKLLPALYGSLVAVSMYFLGKEIFSSKKAGYLSAFITAITPAYVYRTMAGFLEEDSMGFLWFVLGFLFFAKAVKNFEFNKKTILNSLLSGIFFAILVWTWSFYLLVPVFIIAYLLFSLLFICFSKTSKHFFNLLKNSLIVLIVFSISAFSFAGFDWISLILNKITSSFLVSGNYLFIIAPLLIVIIFLAVLLYLLHTRGFKKEEQKAIKTIVLVLLYLSLIFLGGFFLLVKDLRDPSSFFSHSVGEENIGNIFFGIKYNALVLFGYFALLLLPLYITKKENGHLAFIAFIWLMTTLFMAWYKLQYTYVFGLALGIGAAALGAIFFDFLKNRPNIEKGLLLFSLGILLLTGLGASSLFVPDKVPALENKFPDYLSAANWLKENTPKDAKLFNWWNYGHPLCFFSERRVVIENRNHDFKASRDVASFFIAQDLNTALSILKKYQPDYIVLDSSFFFMAPSFAQYKEWSTDYSNPEILPFYAGITYITPCQEKEQYYLCNYLQNPLPKKELEKLPSKWTKIPNQIDPSNKRIPLFAYFIKSEPSELMILNQRVNNSLFAKMWLNSPETSKYFEEVYHKNGVKIFKVKKESFS